MLTYGPLKQGCSRQGLPFNGFSSPNALFFPVFEPELQGWVHWLLSSTEKNIIQSVCRVSTAQRCYVSPFSNTIICPAICVLRIFPLLICLVLNYTLSFLIITKFHCFILGKKPTLATLKHVVDAFLKSLRGDCLSIDHWRRKKWQWKENLLTGWINHFSLSLSWHFLYHLAFTALGNSSEPLCSWALRFQNTAPWPPWLAKVATFILLFLWITKQDIIVKTNRNCCSLLLILKRTVGEWKVWNSSFFKWLRLAMASVLLLSGEDQTLFFANHQRSLYNFLSLLCNLSDWEINLSFKLSQYVSW